MENKQIYEDIRKGLIDINNQEKFFSLLIKGLLISLNDNLSIRNTKIPHYIINTGDDVLYLINKGYDFSLEPLTITNENYIYNKNPRGILTPGGIDVLADQLTSPYSQGIIQLDYNDVIYNISAEFRRIPVKLTIELKYYVDSYTDLLELFQQILSKYCFIRTYNIVYMGQQIKCSYKIPEAFNGEILTDLEGNTTDNKSRILNLSLEIETNYPVFFEKTATNPAWIIKNTEWDCIDKKIET